MFIVSQDGARCAELKNINYVLDYDEKTQEELDRIYQSRYEKVYNYGSTENCMWHIKEAQEEYIAENRCEKVLYLYVNGDLYGTYDDVEKGKLVFRKILGSIKEGIAVADLSAEEATE